MTLKDLARMAGVSVAAASLALSGKGGRRVSEETRARVLALAEKHGYRRLSSAAALKLGKSLRIGLCFDTDLRQSPIIGRFSMYDMIRLASHRLRAAGYGIELLQTDTAVTPAEQARGLSREEVDGLLFLDWKPKLLEPILSHLAQRRIPAIPLNTPLGVQRAWVAIDNTVSFREGLELLYAEGRSRIALFAYGERSWHTQDKLQSYAAFIRDRGLTPFPPIITPDPTPASAAAAMRDVLASGVVPDAVMLSDNLFAPAVQAELRGRDIALLGYGDEAFAQLCARPFRYCRMPMEMVVDNGVDLLLEWLADPDAFGPKQIRIPCELCTLA